MKIHELVEGVEYKANKRGFEDFKFKVMNDILLTHTPGNDWIQSTLKHNFVANLRFEECEFNPKLEEIYYYPSYRFDDGTEHFTWKDDEIDHCIKRTVGVYRTEEQAKEKAKELGWL